MEKRFTAKTDDNSLSEAPDKKTRIILVAVSCVLILGIGIAAAIAISAKKNTEPSDSSVTGDTRQTSTADTTNAPVTRFGAEYPEGRVPTDCMALEWGLLPAEIKVRFPDVMSEKDSNSSEEKNTVNIMYSRSATVGGFAFSKVMLSADRSGGLYAFSYFLESGRYSDILAALNEEYGKPVFRSGGSAYWELDGQVLLNLTLKSADDDGKEYSVLCYISTKEPKATVKPDMSPDIKLGMTTDDARKKISMIKISVSVDGTESYMSEKRYDFSSDANLGKFAAANASAVILNFDPKADLVSYSFVMRGDYLYEIREKVAKEYGNPALNRDYSSEWNVWDGNAVITVTYGRMTGSGRGFATEIKYSISPEGYKAQEFVKAVGRATRKGTTYKQLKDELGKYSPAEKIVKGKGTMSIMNNDYADIIIFGMKVRSVEIEFRKNVVTDVYYIFDGNAYEAIKKNIESNYGTGENKYSYKDRIHRVQWKPKATENNKFSKIMLDYVNLKVNPKARVHYYD
ncbi:MAG: hypothetical protein K5869_05160 [Saccharofermentans sp.]|nr:hypothetical protein [Saccharofermentans sp.]